MRALVVYESMYGNTHTIASNIADGLRATHEVTLVPVAGATAELVAGADLLVVGGPTHLHGLSSASSRQMAAKAAGTQASGLRLDQDTDGPGLRGWLGGVGDGHALAAAFDTRYNGVPAFTGRASRGISKLLKRHGYRLVAAPESFLVSQQNTLLDGEAWRARGWGAALGAAAMPAKADATNRASRNLEQTDQTTAAAAGHSASPDADPVAQIERLAALRDKDIISAEEFESKKTDLMGRL